MPKSKSKAQLAESKLLKAMAELESHIEKSDELEDQDPEGGFSTEGSPLSGAAPKGKSTKKSVASGASSSSDDASSVSKAADRSSMAKMLSASDVASDDASSEAPKKKSKKKMNKAESMSSESGDDDSSSGDDQSSDSDRPAEKSFREAAENDEVLGKAILVNDFLEAMVDQFSTTMSRLAKSLTKEFETQLSAVEGRLNARIDNRVAKSVALQHDFNTRLAKGIAVIGNAVQNDVVDVVKSLVNSPMQPRGKALLSKSDINQPPWAGGAGGAQFNDGAIGSEPDLSELSNLAPSVIGDWLFKKSATNQVDPRVIMAWEADKYDPSTLPKDVQKSIVNDLCK
jgi:hypothetical protein